MVRVVIFKVLLELLIVMIAVYHIDIHVECDIDFRHLRFIDVPMYR